MWSHQLSSLQSEELGCVVIPDIPWNPSFKKLKNLRSKFQFSFLHLVFAKNYCKRQKKISTNSASLSRGPALLLPMKKELKSVWMKWDGWERRSMRSPTSERSGVLYRYFTHACWRSHKIVYLDIVGNFCKSCCFWCITDVPTEGWPCLWRLSLCVMIILCGSVPFSISLPHSLPLSSFAQGSQHLLICSLYEFVGKNMWPFHKPQGHMCKALVLYLLG